MLHTNIALAAKSHMIVNDSFGYKTDLYLDTRIIFKRE